MGIIKLANPLPRITLPNKLANGDTALPWTLDPYLNTVGNAVWGALGATAAKRGVQLSTGSATQNILSQSISSSSPGKLYCEVEDILGKFRLYSGATFPVISEPGYYLMDDSVASSAYLQLDTTYFIYDPSFKSLQFGQLPILANVGNDAWCTGDTPTDAIKLDNGTIALAFTGGSGNLIWKSAWAQSNDVLVEIDVQYLPQGGSLRIITLGGTTALTITTPGRYSVVVNMNAGQDIAVLATEAVSGRAIINSLKARRLTQTWTCEGKPTIRVKTLFAANANYFDRILNPTTIHMATDFQRPNLAGWNPSPNEPVLGYGQMPPPSGYFRKGDTIRNNCAIAGSVSGWRCIASGNPGTWMPLATL